MELNVDIVKELIECLNSSSIDSLRLETDDFKLSLERSAGAVQAVPAAVSQSVITAEVTAPEKKPEAPKGNIVKSPIVGTFYAAASPDKPPYAKVGQAVKRGDTLFVVESMKLMNEVTSEFDGTVAEILVKNGQPVEFGQPIMRIE